MSNDKLPKNLDKYEKNYSDSGFWKKVKKLGEKILQPALLLYYVMKDPTTPTATKATILGALGYLILPVDLVPDFIPALGYTDDLAALFAVIKQCSSHITPKIKAQAEAKAAEIMSSK